MHFIVVGLNHKTADVDVREKCYFSNEKIDDAYKTLNSYKSIKGSVILSTCNRVEIYATTENVKLGFEEITDFLSSYHGIIKENISPALYKKNCQQAVMHLLKVAAGIDSMVIGEYQIQGQVRDAYHLACSLNSPDNYLNKLFQNAINTGKRVRSETEIGKGSVSVATLAVELITQVFDHKEQFNVLLVGAGKMANLTASNLKDFKTCSIKVTNRSIDKAQELAAEFQGVAIDYNQRYNEIKTSEIIIVSTSSDNYTIEKSEIQKLMDNSPFRTKIFIDLSIPRNIDPSINEIENCMVYSIDDINKIIDLNVNKRSMEVDRAEKIITEISEEYYSWYYKQIILPTMLEIKGKFDILKDRTIASYKTEFGSMSDIQQKLIREMLDSYSDKLIKAIMKNIKNFTSKEDMISIAETLKNSFNIESVIVDDSKESAHPHAHQHPHSH